MWRCLQVEDVKVDVEVSIKRWRWMCLVTQASLPYETRLGCSAPTTTGPGGGSLTSSSTTSLPALVQYFRRSWGARRTQLSSAQPSSAQLSSAQLSSVQGT